MIHECQSWRGRVFLFKIPSQGCPDLIFGAQSDFGSKRDLSKANMGIKATFTGGSDGTGKAKQKPLKPGFLPALLSGPTHVEVDKQQEGNLGY